MIGGDEAVVERAQPVDVLALHRLGGDDPGGRVVLFEAAAVAHQRAPGAEPADEGGDAVELLEDLYRGAVVVGERVGLVAVLVGHEVGGVALGHLERLGDRPVGALRPLRVDDLGPVHAQQLGPLGGHVVGHHGGEWIALATADHRQRDPGVAGGRLDQRLPGADRSLRLGPVDHRLGDAILDRAGRVAALELGVDADAGARRQARQLDQRRVADRIEDVLEAPPAGPVEQLAGHRFTKCSKGAAPAPLPGVTLGVRLWWHCSGPVWGHRAADKYSPQRNGAFAGMSKNRAWALLVLVAGLATMMIAAGCGSDSSSSDSSTSSSASGGTDTALAATDPGRHADRRLRHSLPTVRAGRCAGLRGLRHRPDQRGRREARPADLDQGRALQPAAAGRRRSVSTWRSPRPRSPRSAPRR